MVNYRYFVKIERGDYSLQFIVKAQSEEDAIIIASHTYNAPRETIKVTARKDIFGNTIKYKDN